MCEIPHSLSVLPLCDLHIIYRFAGMGKKSKQKSAKKVTTYRFNRGVDSVFLHTEWAIDEMWGLQQLARYTDQVDQVSHNSELGGLLMEQIKLQKQSQVPQYLAMSDGGAVVRHNDESEDIPKGSIALLKLKGVMRMDDSLSHRGVSSLCNDIQLCNANPNISAIVVEVDSGGGLSLAGQMLKNAVADSHIPVVAYGHFVASAAVHGTAPADHIMLAGNSTEMGSVGSMVTVNKAMVQFYKENYEDLYSTVSPNKNFAWREYLKGNKGPLIESVTKNAQSFQNEMRKFRNLNPSMENETLSGGMFLADDAVQRGLADSVGTLNDAILLAHRLGNAATDNINSINHTNNNTMNYKASWIALVATLNAMFGASFDNSETANPETTNAGMDLAGKMKSFKDSIIAEVSTNLNAMIANLQKDNAALTAKVAELTAAQSTETADVTDLAAKVASLETNVAALTDQNTKLIADKKDIETQLAQMQGKPDPANTETSDAAPANPAPASSVGKFNAQLDALQPLDGESKY